MRTFWAFRAAISIALGCTLLLAEEPAGQRKTIENQKDKISYALGVDLGRSLRERAVDLDPAVFAEGLRHSLGGTKTLMTDEEIRAAIMDLKVQQKQKVLAQHKAKSDAFIATNKKKPGVVTRESGLQYKILHAGKGGKPAPGDTVVCHYRGYHIDGTEFENTYTRNQPVTFRVDGAVKAWVEALQLMPVGSKWEIVVPPELARTVHSSSSLASNVVIFELELVEIKKKS
jgi:FKBP-type peptidyl-prolyl cis-trans isomerase